MSELATEPQLRLRTNAIADAIEATDHVRRSDFSVGGRAGHKEWHHFAILAPGIDLLVNFSCCDDLRPAAETGAELLRLVLLVRANGWDGSVETFAPETSRVRGGRIDLAFDHNRLVFRDGAFEITAAARERPIVVTLRLEPLTAPAFVPGIPMIDGPPLHWVVVPRLRTSGTLVLDGVTHDLDGAPAYHDHNWGYFLWGHDVAWEWGFVLPDDAAVPWCCTFVRLTNRARTVALAHKMLLWKGERLVRVFREHETTAVTAPAFLRPSEVGKIPRAMALVAPELVTDVPRTIETRAAADGDWLTCVCTPEAVGQVLIPSETELGVTIFNEVSAGSFVEGYVGGERVCFTGRSVLEFIRYA